MKISIEIDLSQHLTAEELAQFRRQCEHAQIQPESEITNLIRAALQAEKEAA